MINREFPNPSSGEREKPQVTAEVVTGFDEKTLAELEAVEKATFSEQIQNSREEMEELLKDPDALHVVIKDKDGGIVGYVLGEPSEAAAAELQEYDKQFQPDEKTFYVESIGLKPESRGLEEFLAGTRAFVEEARRRGFSKIALHTHAENPLNRVLQKRYQAKNLRRVENWYDTGEPYDYLEMDVEPAEENSQNS